MSKLGFLSVIIPTYRDWGRLNLCLEALRKQTSGSECFEVIVVNNDPNDSVPENFEISSNCRVTSESAPGSYAARNKGASLAKGDVLAFTDADCIPDIDWVSNILKHYSSHNGVLSGYVEMFSVRNSRFLNFSECYDYVFGINQEIYKDYQVGATANLSFDRKSFNSVGGFDAKLLSGGDVDICKRVVSEGAAFIYDEGVRVKHPLRFDLKDLLVKAKRLTSGKIKKSKLKGFLTAIAPPLVRLRILFFKKNAPVYVKFKAFFVLVMIKLVQVFYAPLVLLFDVSERR